MTRCPERTRTEQGYLRCHDDSGHAGPCHCSDRSWAPLRFTPPCHCADDDVLSYYGGPLSGLPGFRRDGWPNPWKDPGPRKPTRRVTDPAPRDANGK